MNYLSRDGAPVSALLWQQIDDTVVQSARRVLTARRFLHLFGPLGIETQSIQIDKVGAVEEQASYGTILTKGRRYVQIPTLYQDFTLLAKDLETSEKRGFAPDLSAAVVAAQYAAFAEDKLIFLGDKAAGYEGLITAMGANKIKKGDWATGENAFSDIAAGLETLVQKGVYGSYALTLSPDLYTALQRLQPATGLLETDRIAKLVDGHLYKTPVLGKGKAVLVGAEAGNMDLAVGQDMATAYLEQKDLNHCFRILETVLLRVKRGEAIVVFE